ncbi:MAG: PD-(D/E)XK nuclease domain-containing protein [Selenomonadaceae bacterium]|nr:PD-(D/E)XK nuclease domain-containing protein [Selenomonadaceae bacterium]
MELRIPNREVRSVYTSEILNQIDRMGGASSLPDLLDDLLNGRADAFATGLNDYLETIASYYDTANRENFYHGFLLGLLALLVPDYAVRSNRESGYGRFDIAVFPAQGQPSGILMEFKVADSEAELPAKAQEALTQIDHMNYPAEFRAQNVNDVWKYGIAFCGKKTQIASHKQKSLSQGVLSVLS